MRRSVLWGHHVDEYQEMFGLREQDLKLRFLEYGCGATAFNSELHAQGAAVVSCDPMFDLDATTIVSAVSSSFEDSVIRLIETQDQFDFSHYGSLDALIQYRREGVNAFFRDYEKGKIENRYLPTHTPALPWTDFTFDFALCAHSLLGEGGDKSIDASLQTIRELARVAKDVRIFPLIDRFGQPSPLIGPLLLLLQQEQYGVEVREVSYSLQPQGNAMLRIWAQQCQLN